MEDFGYFCLFAMALITAFVLGTVAGSSFKVFQIEKCLGIEISAEEGKLVARFQDMVIRESHTVEKK